MAIVNNITRVALYATLVVFSIIVMGLSAKNVRDGNAYNNLLKKYVNYADTLEAGFSLGAGGTFNSGFRKRDYRFGDIVIHTAPIGAFAVDLTFSLLSMFAAGASIFFSITGSLSVLLCLITDAVLAVLWLVAMAYSAQAFNHTDLFTSFDGLFPIPKADFAFIVLSFVLSLVLLVFSIIDYISVRNGENAPEPPVADTTAEKADTGVPEVHDEHFMPTQQSGGTQQPAMNVPV